MSRTDRSRAGIVLGRQRLPRSRPHRTIIAWLRPLLLVGVVAIGSALVAAGLFPLFASAGVAVKVADTKFLSQSDVPLDLPTLTQRSTIYAADGSVLATLYRGQNRVVYPLSAYNAYTRHAVLAIEDHNFYQHGAVDLTSIIRALVKNVQAGGIVQGGSTITQQLVKNTETGNEQTLQRKILEAQDAIRLERTYSKDRILELYLNTIYMGNSVYGIGTAAQYYFDKTPQELNIPESALLAGMIAAPEGRDPTAKAGRPDARAFRDEVLRKMLLFDWITPKQFVTASGVPIKLSNRGRIANRLGPNPFWVDYVKHLFLSDPRFGATLQQRADLLYQGGLQIHTTLQPALQHVAQQALDSRFSLPSEPQAAAVTVNPKTGAILAMASGNETYGTGRGQSTLNLGWQAHRHTGSAFKAFTLAAALEKGIQPGAVYKWKSPVTIPHCGGGVDYPLSNSEGGGAGVDSLRVATADSINVVFAKVIDQVGPQAVVDAAHAMGITSPLPAVCSLTLGTGDVSPLEMTGAYSTLANGGVHCLPFAISRIVGPDGRTAFKAVPKCHQAIPAGIAATETDILRGVIDFGTASRTTKLPDWPARPEAGKTGTDQDFHNAWFVGYVPQVATGVWVGYRDNQTRSVDGVNGLRGFGADQAGPVWRDVMAFATRNLPIEQFPKPPPEKHGTVPNVVGKTVDAASKILIAASFSPSVDPTAIPCDQPKGVVCTQSPAGGATEPLGTIVTLTISDGTKPKVTVPNVVGATRAAAAARLRAAGFGVTVVTQNVKDPKQDGVVLSQSPSGGADARQGATVTIVVGKLKSKPHPSPSPSPTKGAVPARAGRGGGDGDAFPLWAGPVFLLPAGALGAMRRRRRRRRRGLGHAGR